MTKLVLDDDSTLFLMSLVEEYPALWDIGSPDYSKSHLKTSIWQQVSEDMTGRFPQFGPYTVENLKLFLQYKRRTFREEKKKILKTKSGQPADDLYLGKWKFFAAMKFLDTTQRTLAKRSTSEDIEVVEVDGEPQATPGCSVTQAPSPTSSSSSAGARTSASATPKRKHDATQLSLMEERTAVLSKIAKSLDVQEPDDSAAFGMVVAQHLRHMPTVKRAKCLAAILSLVTSYLDE
ncbi:unnamed protein product [Ixodes hexagonus]